MPELYFKGKEFVYNHHLSVPYRPLVPDAAKSVGAPSLNGNLIIHGDNLHALKALLPMYAGKVDCIYIDPPYNTGEQSWEYNDRVNSPMMNEWLSSNPINKDDMLRHDKWCAMMWPRLVLLKELLSETGMIFISINDIEASNLRLIMDEIFGESKFLCQMVWKSRLNKDNRNTTGISLDHEYIFVYGEKVKGDERKEEQYSNPDNDPRGAWASGNMVGLASAEKRPNLHYPLINPETGINYGIPEQGWRYEPPTMNRLIAEGKVLWPNSPTGRPREKAFLDELTKSPNTSSLIGEGIYTKDGTGNVQDIFSSRAFMFPKPVDLIKQIIRQGCPESGLFLDSFAGSGTTAHAILDLNKTENCSRSFILVECEDYADTLTAERVRRVIQGYEFKGTQKEELLRESLTWTKLKSADSLLEKVSFIEQANAARFDNISKTVKDGELIVTGEKKITERTEGLGGEFTYCTLGPELDIDKILTGETLPDYLTLGAWLFHTATGESFDPSKAKPKNWYLGESAAYHLWLVYRPELDYLKSAEAALTLSLAEKIAKTKGKKHLVFAPAKYVPNNKLLPMGVEYAPLPFALYRIEKG
jgi:adenine-specific DNA-methyltransferase